MKMHKEIRTKTGGISRIHIERAAREAGYSMGSHHCHPYFALYYVENGACRFTIDDNMYDLQHAAAELISTDDTITQIALRCGFSDSNYFKDVFKNKYGVTPRENRSGI